jgi:hypothetical protein
MNEGVIKMAGMAVMVAFLATFKTCGQWVKYCEKNGFLSHNEDRAEIFRAIWTIYESGNS